MPPNPYVVWSHEDWVRHYAGPRLQSLGPRAEVGSVWDPEGRRLPGEAVRYATGLRVVTPEDVKQAKLRLDGKYKSVEEDVMGCASLGEPERRAFAVQVRTWRTFFCGGQPGCAEPAVSYGQLGTQMDEVERYDKQLYDWQRKLSAKCTLSLPVEKVATEEERTAASIKPALMFGAAAAALYFFGPTIHKELFAPAVVRRDLVDERRRRSVEAGDDEPHIDSGHGLAPDLAEKASRLLGETAHQAGRAVGEISKLTRDAAKGVRRGALRVERWAEEHTPKKAGNMRALPEHDDSEHEYDDEE